MRTSGSVVRSSVHPVKRFENAQTVFKGSVHHNYKNKQKKLDKFNVHLLAELAELSNSSHSFPQQMEF